MKERRRDGRAEQCHDTEQNNDNMSRGNLMRTKATEPKCKKRKHPVKPSGKSLS